MGWFWADAPATPRVPVDKHTKIGHVSSAGQPPPSCPMHRSSTSVTRLGELSGPDTSSSYLDHGSSAAYISTLNPLNLMPKLPIHPIYANQPVPLPGYRTVSSIPRGESPEAGNWEYPSPQQMYNAMRNKGYVESHPGEAASIVNMVEVHNFLNEGAWGEILQWEQEFGTPGGWVEAAKRRWQTGGVAPPPPSPPPPSPPLPHASDAWRSPFPSSPSPSSSAFPAHSKPEPRLLRFQGRSQEPTPKARILQLVAQVAPNSRFATPPPFDRHDWYVLRPNPDRAGEAQEVRYVIDYYAGEPEPTGEPVFYLDVRPALDRPAAVMERAIRWGGELWWKATGAAVRERERERERKEGELWGK